MRAVDSKGEKSTWYSKVIHTPKAPVLVALGDSITSGHNRTSDTATTICEDPSYGYPQYVFDNFEKQLPAAWRSSGNYFNYAVSGFSLDNVIEGGTDACGVGQPSSLNEATDLLSDYEGSWNQVVISGGIDSTNWGAQLVNIVASSLVGTKLGYTAKECAEDIGQWNGTQSAVQSNIKSDVTQITGSIRALDAGATIDWISYYNVAGTGTPGISGGVVDAVPSSCKAPIQKSLNVLQRVIQSGFSGQSVNWINVSKVLSGNDLDLQDLYPTDVVDNKLGNPSIPGWPHPNSMGAQAIAARIKHY